MTSNYQAIQREINEIQKLLRIDTKPEEDEKNDEKPMEIKFHYFNGRGYSEPSRVLLSALGLTFTQRFLKEPEELEELRANGNLVYGQLPLVQFGGHAFTQQGAIIRHIARKYDMYGCNDHERYMIDVVYEGTRDAREPLTNYYQHEDVNKIAFNHRRYFGAWEKLLGQNSDSVYFTSKASFADVAVYEVIDYVAEIFGESQCAQWMEPYKHLRILADSVAKMGRLAEYKKERKAQPYDEYRKDVWRGFQR